MLPLVIGMEPPILPGDGEKWFKSQSEEVQKKIMGPGKLSAYREGKFKFSQLTSMHEDSVYGRMEAETPLKDLVPEEP